MKESAPNEESSESGFRPPKNFSVYSTAGELTPAPDRKYPYNHYVDNDNKEYFYLSDIGNNNEEQPRQKQMVVAQLASLIMPIAPVFKKQSEESGQMEYFSAHVNSHPEHNPKIHHISRADYTLLYTLFDDNDHSDRHNYESGVIYDFGNAQLIDKHSSEDKYWKGAVHMTEGESKEILEAKIKTFKEHIDGPDGLEFIRNTCKHAGYTEVAPEEIQNKLLKPPFNSHVKRFL